MKRFAWMMLPVFLLISLSAQAYTCRCLGTQIIESGSQTGYSGSCRIQNVNQVIPNGSEYTSVVLNNTGNYKATTDLLNFITSASLANDLDESHKKFASVYDQTTGFLCGGVPALSATPDAYAAANPPTNK